MKIAVIGAGAMGGATVEGLIKGQQFKNEDITVSDPSQAVVDKFAKTGVSVTTDNKLAAETADIVCVVVKPWLVERVLKDIKDELNPTGLSQDDGVGFWGRANANGPSLAVLVRELDAGFSFSAYRGALNDSVKETPSERYLTDEQWRRHPVWKRAMRGDIMKIFWNRNATKGHDGGAIIGYDGVRGHLQEAGHSVIFLGISTDGRVMYWSSNGPGPDPQHMGYSVGSCDPTAIQRVVFTRILRPERFDAVRHMAHDNVNRYLYDLNGTRHSSTSELKQQIGEK